MNVECANWYFNSDDIFCPECGREVALHGIPLKNKKIQEAEEDKQAIVKQLLSTKPEITKELIKGLPSPTVQFYTNRIPLIVIWFVLWVFYSSNIYFEGILGWLLIGPLLMLSFYLFVYPILVFSNR